MRKRAMILATLALIVGVLASCQPGRVGARCRTTDFGDDGGAWVLTCTKGRWQRALTKQQAAQIILSLNPPAPPTPPPRPPIAIPPPSGPAEVRVRAMAEVVWASTHWLPQITGTAWFVVPDEELKGMSGRADCSYEYRDGLPGYSYKHAEVRITQSSADAPAEDLADLVAHEGAHIVACDRWPETSAPPGFPPGAMSGVPAEAFADCLGKYLRGPDFYEFYGCPGPEWVEQAATLATP
jgi:hypothetical protein